MASKRKSREQARAKRRKIKIKKAKKLARVKKLLFKQFSGPQPEEQEPVHYFSDDYFEYILADEQASLKNQRDILFRKYGKF